MAHLRLALRTLFRTPFVTAVAVASLAFGIGANAAIFSLFDQMLLRPLPVAAPERLVNLGAPGPKPGSQSCSNAGRLRRRLQLRRCSRSREGAGSRSSGIAAHVSFGANLAYRGQTMNGDGMLVSGSYFPDARHSAGGRAACSRQTTTEPSAATSSSC